MYAGPIITLRMAINTAKVYYQGYRVLTKLYGSINIILAIRRVILLQKEKTFTPKIYKHETKNSNKKTARAGSYGKRKRPTIS